MPLIITSILYIYKAETQEVGEKISLLVSHGTFKVILWKTILKKFSVNVCIKCSESQKTKL